jgi:hypothetical protein
MPARINRSTDSPDVDPDRRLVVLIKDSLHYRLRVLAAEQRTTIADLVREAIEREIARRREGVGPLTRHPPPAHPADREIATRQAAGTEPDLDKLKRELEELRGELSGPEPSGPGLDKLKRELDELRGELSGSEHRMRQRPQPKDDIA